MTGVMCAEAMIAIETVSLLFVGADEEGLQSCVMYHVGVDLLLLLPDSDTFLALVYYLLELKLSFLRGGV